MFSVESGEFDSFIIQGQGSPERLAIHHAEIYRFPESKSN